MTLISTHRSFHYGLITFTLTIIIFTLMGQPAFADSPGKKSGSDPNSDNNNLYDQQASFSPSMGVIIIVLIAALFFMGFFSIYIRHCSGASTTSGGLSRRGGVLGAVARSVRGGPRGLDRAVVDSFPTFSYAAVKELKVGKGALECAVCLNEFEDDDTLRLIPTCDHVFHPQCIDEWLVGHTTCPVCRTNLADGGASFQAPPEASGDATVVEVIEECDDVITADDHENSNNPEERESMEAPLHGMGRSRTVRSGSVGRPRWFERFTRSFSTGHVAIEQWERFTLRLPEDVRKQVMSGQLDRSSSLVALPRETSSRRGYRTGFGEGSRSTRATHRFGSLRVDRGSARSDRWVFSLAPPFFSRVPSLRSPKVAAEVGGRHGSVRGESINQLPV